MQNEAFKLYSDAFGFYRLGVDARVIDDQKILSEVAIGAFVPEVDTSFLAIPHWSKYDGCLLISQPGQITLEVQFIEGKSRKGYDVFGVKRAAAIHFGAIAFKQGSLWVLYEKVKIRQLGKGKKEE